MQNTASSRRFPPSSFRFQVSGFRFLLSAFLFQVSSFRSHVFCIPRFAFRIFPSLLYRSLFGSYGGGTNTKLILSSTLTQDFLGQVKFDGFGQGAVQFGSVELAPIPEPATIVGAFAFLGLIVLRERRRLTALLIRKRQLSAS